jgi:hypothetical protein
LVCSFADFQDNHITLQTQVYDVDSYDKIKDLVSDLASMSGNVAVTFPVIAPFIAAGGSVASSILELVNQLDRHDKIMESNLRLEIAEESTGSQLLQTGHWVYFERPQAEKALKLDPNLQVRDANTGTVFDGCSYAIFTVRREETQEPNWEIDQKVAKLLSELNGKGNSGKAAIEFLRDTMDGHNKFKKLKRIEELENIGADKRSEEEIDLLSKLKSDESLKPFLPPSPSSIAKDKEAAAA